MPWLRHRLAFAGVAIFAIAGLTVGIGTVEPVRDIMDRFVFFDWRGARQLCVRHHFKLHWTQEYDMRAVHTQPGKQQLECF